MSAHPQKPVLSLTDTTADFLLSPEEVNKGDQALSACLKNSRGAEALRNTEEALNTLAIVISGGACNERQFPWHQTRPYHAALALAMVRQNDAPSEIEALRCRHDDTHRFRQVPDRYSAKQVQRMKIALRAVTQQCCELGFMDEDEKNQILTFGKAEETSRKTKGQRILDEAEVRALVTACEIGDTVAGHRDGLMIGIAYAGGLKSKDLISLDLDALMMDKKSGRLVLRFKDRGAKRARKIPLGNYELIVLEDWLEDRGREAGPLLCPIGRNREVQLKRLNATEIRKTMEQRAEQSGVMPFGPSDLARSSPRKADLKRKGNGATGAQKMAKVSPLYTPGDKDDETPERIHFPYRSMIGR